MYSQLKIAYPLPVAKIWRILVLIWKADHVPTFQPLRHASAEGIHRIELDGSRTSRLRRHLGLWRPGQRSGLAWVGLARTNSSSKLAEELVDLGPQEHGHQGQEDRHQAHQLPEAKLNDEDEDAGEEEEEDEEEVEEEPVDEEPTSALKHAPHLKKGQEMKNRKTYQEEICQET